MGRSHVILWHMAYRVCSECGNTLEGSDVKRKTCGDACRSKRSRRLKRQRKETGKKNAMPQHQAEVTERIANAIPDVAHEVIEEELRPVVRESITADTLKAIAAMVALTPSAVAGIAEDLQSEDAVVRQRAYTLIMKYTVGHQAIVRPPEEEKGNNITVNFDLPRPDTVTKVNGDTEVIETRLCDSCEVDKPVDEFVANSSRCRTCYEKQQDQVAELLHGD